MSELDNIHHNTVTLLPALLAGDNVHLLPIAWQVGSECHNHIHALCDKYVLDGRMLYSRKRAILRYATKLDNGKLRVLCTELIKHQGRI